MSIACPVCESETLTTNRKEIVLREPFAGTTEVVFEDYKCDTCGYEGSSSNNNEITLKNAHTELKSKAIKNILEFFSYNDYNFASMERVLGLPQRTLTKWKSNQTNPSSSALTLFKFLRTFPWLLNIAEEKFDFDFAQNFLMKGALNQLVDTVYPDCNISVDLFTTAEYHYLVAKVATDPTSPPMKTLTTANIQNNKTMRINAY